MEGYHAWGSFWLDNYTKINQYVITNHILNQALKNSFEFIDNDNVNYCKDICVTSIKSFVNSTINSIVIGVDDELFNKIQNSHYRYVELNYTAATPNDYINYNFITVLVAIIIWCMSKCFPTKHKVTEKESDEQCSICLEDFKLNEEIEFTLCQHLFHINCLEKWCEINSVCPLCKSEIKIL